MKMASLYTGLGLSYFQEIRTEVNIRISASLSRTSATGMYNILLVLDVQTFLRTWTLLVLSICKQNIAAYGL